MNNNNEAKIKRLDELINNLEPHDNDLTIKSLKTVCQKQLNPSNPQKQNNDFLWDTKTINEVINSQYPDKMNQLDKKSRTPLLFCYMKGMERKFSLLLKNGADPNIEMPQGTCLLYFILEDNSHPNFYIHSLLNHPNIDLNHVDSSGDTSVSLEDIIMEDDVDCFNELIDKGATITDRALKTIIANLDKAKNISQINFFEHDNSIEINNNHLNDLIYIINDKSIDYEDYKTIFHNLLNHPDLNINQKDEGGNTIIQQLFNQFGPDNINIISILSQRCDVNWDVFVDNTGSTSLHELLTTFIKTFETETINNIINQSDVNSQDFDGNTALIKLAHFYKYDPIMPNAHFESILETLVQNDISFDIENKSGLDGLQSSLNNNQALFDDLTYMLEKKLEYKVLNNSNKKSNKNKKKLL